MNFGIIGAGWIGRKFCSAVKLTEGAQMCAIASTDLERAKKWAQEENVPLYYGSHEEMLKNDDIDIVYIATTNNHHVADIELCLNAGKHVMCEKPMTLNKADAEKVAKLAREKKLFLMECMWSRFTPVAQKVREWIRTGRIGTVNMAQADVGFIADKNPKNRLFNPELGGGAMYDIGVYPLDLFTYYLNADVTKASALIQPAVTGVDASISLNLAFTNGAIANLQSSVTTKCAENMHLYGTEGYIRIPGFYYSNTAYLHDAEGNLTETFTCEDKNSFCYEIEAALKDIANGCTENKTAPLDMTIKAGAVYDLIIGDLTRTNA